VFPGSDEQFQEKEKPTILMVEDEAIVRMVTAEEFRVAGFRVIECASADEAMDLLLAGKRFDVLFTDVRMPGEMNGIALAKAARRLAPDLPVIIASAHLEASDAAGFDGFLAKPFPSDTAIALIRRLLEERAQPPSGMEPA
jgi:two-component system, response regulator PdtaR